MVEQQGRSGSPPGGGAIPPQKLMSPKEVAEILGLSVTTLAVWRCRGTRRLPYIKVGRLVMYEPSAVENFIRENRVDFEVL